MKILLEVAIYVILVLASVLVLADAARTQREIRQLPENTSSGQVYKPTRREYTLAVLLCLFVIAVIVWSICHYI